MTSNIVKHNVFAMVNGFETVEKFMSIIFLLCGKWL